jgi:hypothetical protein
MGSLSAGGQQHQVSHFFARLEKFRKSTKFSFVSLLTWYGTDTSVKQKKLPYVSCMESSVLDPDSMGSLDPYPDPDSQSVSRSRRAKDPHK